MHGHLFGERGAPNTQIAEGSFLAGESLLPHNRVPLLALRNKGIPQAPPNDDGARDRRCVVLLIFVALLLFGKLCRQVFLRGLLGAFIPHGPSPGP